MTVRVRVGVGVRVHFICMKLNDNSNRLLELLNVVTSNLIGLQRVDWLKYISRRNKQDQIKVY